VTDLSQMSNEDLMAAAGISSPQAAAPQAAAPPMDLSGVSNDDLMKAASAAPQNNAWYRPLAMAGSGVVKGLADVVAPLLGGAAASGAAEGGLPDPMQYLQPTTDAYKAIPQDAGITSRPDLQPQGMGERVLSAGGEGAGAALPLSVIGGPAMLARGAIQGAGAGALGELASEFFPKHPVIARIIGGLAGGAAAGGLTSMAERGVRSLAGQTTPMTQAYDNLGIRTDLAGDVTGNKTLQGIQAMAGQAPAGGKVAAAAEGTISDFGQAVQRTAQMLGPSTTQQEAGTALQRDATGWLNDWNKASQIAWNKVGMYMPPTAPVGTSNTQAIVTKLASEMGDAPELASVLNNTKFNQIKDALDASGTGSGGTLSYRTMSSFLSDIGQRIGDPGIASDIPTGKLKALYGGILSDIQGAMPKGAATDAFNTARDITRGGHNFVENYVSNIIGSPKSPIRPEDAAAFALSGAPSGGTRLDALRAGGLGQGVDNIAAWKLRDMALANPGRQGPAGATISPSTFLTEANKMSPEAARALFPPNVASNLADLRTVAGNMKSTEAMANTSKTGSYLATKEAIDLFKNAGIGAAAGGSMAGLPGAAAGAVLNVAAPFAPGYLGGMLTASPRLTRLMATPTYRPPPGLGLLTAGAGIAPGLLQGSYGR
jgi:hypothetical protein